LGCDVDSLTGTGTKTRAGQFTRRFPVQHRECWRIRETLERPHF
jgi:hypothetical protein